MGRLPRCTLASRYSVTEEMYNCKIARKLCSLRRRDLLGFTRACYHFGIEAVEGTNATHIQYRAHSEREGFASVTPLTASRAMDRD